MLAFFGLVLFVPLLLLGSDEQNSIQGPVDLLNVESTFEDFSDDLGQVERTEILRRFFHEVLDGLDEGSQILCAAVPFREALNNLSLMEGTNLQCFEKFCKSRLKLFVRLILLLFLILHC